MAGSLPRDSPYQMHKNHENYESSEAKKYRRSFKPCREIVNNGTCSWGDRCGYNHSTEEKTDHRHDDYRRWFEENYVAPMAESPFENPFSNPSSKNGVLNLMLEFQEVSASILEAPLGVARQTLEEALETHAKACATQNMVLQNILSGINDRNLYDELNAKYADLQRIHALNREEIRAHIETILRPTRLAGRARTVGDAFDQDLA